MQSVAMVGLAFGMRHAMEADHVAAVASLAVRSSRSAGSAARLAACWGMGHAVTILAIGAVALISGARIPETFLPFLDGLVGVMLLALGVSAIRQRMLMPEPSKVHRDKDCRRATLVGALHGAAGSAALILLTATHAHSVLLGIAQLVLFGAGALVGMFLLSLLLSLPLSYWGRNGQKTVSVLVGIATASVGLWVLLQLSQRMRWPPLS